MRLELAVWLAAFALTTATVLACGGVLSPVFLISGLFDEIALSLPVRGGFGLPTAYFALHGLLVVAEDRYARRWPRWAVRAVVFASLLLPLPLLFHPPFVRGVVWPLAGIATP